MILAQLKSQNQEKAMRLLFALSQLSLVVVLVGQRFCLAWVPGWFPLDFIFGLLTGLSLVGNLTSLLYYGRRFPFKKDGSDERKN